MTRVPPPTINDNDLLALIVEADIDQEPQARARLDGLLASDAIAKRRADEIYRMWDLLETQPVPRQFSGSRDKVHRALRALRPRTFFNPLVGRAVAASLIFAVLALGALSLAPSPAPRPGGFVIATEKAERRAARLPDGSTIELSGDSAVEVKYSSGRRNIRLLRGQALFEVAHNPSRPFVVNAGKGEILAVGTAFDVDLTQRGVIVTVTKGVVRVTAPRVGANLAQSATLKVGQQIAYSERGNGTVATISSPRAVDVESVTAWKQGMLEFRGEPLSQVIEEVNRHAVGQVVLLDPADADIPIYGVLRVGDLEGLASILRDRNSARARTDSPVRIDQHVE